MLTATINIGNKSYIKVYQHNKKHNKNQYARMRVELFYKQQIY